MTGRIALLCAVIAWRRRSSRRNDPIASKPPALGPPPTLDLPAIQKRMLSNGLPVWIVETHEVPVVQVNLVVLVGSGDDPAGQVRPGQPHRRDARRGRGQPVRARDCGRDRVRRRERWRRPVRSTPPPIRLNVPVERLQDALPIMADVALRPTFPEEELNRLRQERITALIQARDEPESIAPLAFSRLLYGADASLRHRRHRHAERTLEGDDDARISRRFTRRITSPRTPRSSSSATSAPTRRRRSSKSSSATWKGGAPAKRVAVPTAPQRPRRRDRDRGQAGRRAVADPDRVDWRGARHAGLLRPAGAEHDPRRLVHLAAEPESAREERLCLRRRLSVRHAARSRPLLRRRRRADGQDGGSAAGVLQRAQRHYESRFPRTS